MRPEGFEEHGTTVTDEKNQKSEFRYPLPCPVCSTAMIGEKSDPSSPDYDRFECLACGAVVLREDSAPENSTA